MKKNEPESVSKRCPQTTYWNLFGWSTTTNNDYGKSDSEDNDYYTGTFRNWGTLSIENGGDAADLWRTPTPGEWAYLINTLAGGLHADYCTIDGVYGIAFYPPRIEQ